MTAHAQQSITLQVGVDTHGPTSHVALVASKCTSKIFGLDMMTDHYLALYI